MTHPLDIDQLLANSGWIWRLARSLVADDPTADDVLQETLVVALERSERVGKSGPSLRAWLSTVARRVALRRRRSEVRRSEREHAAARPLELPPADRVLERETARRRLVEHVLSLDELYRDAILLRYFDELEPIEIARRLGIPDSTVRNRLRRGLAQLQVRLDCERGEGWRQWCLLLAPMGTGGAKTSLAPLSGWTAGLLAMGTKLALILVAAFAALATVLSWHAVRPAVDRAPRTADVATRPVPRAAVLDREAVEPDATKSAVARAASRTPSLAANSAEIVRVLSYGSVRTKEGAAVTSGTVSIQDATGRGRSCSLDSRGWYSFAGVAPGKWTIRARCDGCHPFEMPVELPKDESLDRRDLVLDAATILRVRIRTASTQGEAGGGSSSTPADARLSVVATRDAPSARLEATSTRKHYAYGLGTYVGREGFGSRSERIPDGFDAILEVDGSLPCFASLVLRDVVIETKLVPAGVDEVEFLVDPGACSRLLGRARVRLVDADTGSPLHPARVQLNTSDTGGGGVDTGEDGVAELGDLLPGLLELDVHAKDHSWCQRSVEVLPGETTDLGTLRITKACRIAGHVVDESGAPVSANVSWLDAEASERPDRFRYFYSAEPDSEGRFRFEGVPRGRLMITATPRENDVAPTCSLVDTSGGDQGDVVLRVAHGRAVGIQIEEAGACGETFALRRSDGMALVVDGWIGPGPMPLRLADGAYRIEIWSQGRVARSQEIHVSRDGELFRIGP
jgi:RNA polymerase sigma-70 factor (ECF subfamily)